MAWKRISASPLLKALRGGKDGARRENAEEDRQAAPRSGRTGGLGARAERPSEGGNGRSEPPPPPEPGRKSRAPSAAHGHGLRHQRG